MTGNSCDPKYSTRSSPYPLNSCFFLVLLHTTTSTAVKLLSPFFTKLSSYLDSITMNTHILSIPALVLVHIFEVRCDTVVVNNDILTLFVPFDRHAQNKLRAPSARTSGSIQRSSPGGASSLIFR